MPPQDLCRDFDGTGGQPCRHNIFNEVDRGCQVDICIFIYYIYVECIYLYTLVKYVFFETQETGVNPSMKLSPASRRSHLRRRARTRSCTAKARSFVNSSCTRERNQDTYAHTQITQKEGNVGRGLRRAVPCEPGGGVVIGRGAARKDRFGVGRMLPTSAR